MVRKRQNRFSVTLPGKRTGNVTGKRPGNKKTLRKEKQEEKIMSEKELEHAKILKARKEIETIESKEELEYEAKLKERLDALQRKWENRLKKKSDAKIKAERLTKDGIVKDVLYILGLKDDFDKCENLASFDMIRERIKNEITFLKEFHTLNCDVEEIVVPNTESETDGKALLENSETPESSEDPVSETVEMKETEKSGPEEN